ncbi:MAG: DUF5411 family protein [Anaerorhabdus sp.]
MAGVVKSGGIFMFGIICVLLVVSLNKRLVLEEDIFESTRATQLSVMEESLLLGELFVNRKLVIDQDQVIESWISLFMSNKDSSNEIEVSIVDISEIPPAIVVRVQSEDYLVNQEKIEIDYTNLILVEERK